MNAKPTLSWLLVPVSLGAFVATWGGWAKLATMTGYGPTELWPGSGWTVDTGVVLPLTVEPFGAMAMAVAFNPKVKGWARSIATILAVITLAAAGVCQVVVHRLTVAGSAVAPDWVVGITSVLPVLALGLSGGLAMLNVQRRPEDETSQNRPGTGLMGRLGTALGQAVVGRAERLAEASQRPVPASRPTVPPADVPASQPDVPEVPATATNPVPQVSQDDVPAGQEVESSVPLLSQVERIETARDMVLADPDVSQRAVADRLGISKSTVNRMWDDVLKAVEFKKVILADRPTEVPGTVKINGFDHHEEVSA